MNTGSVHSPADLESRLRFETMIADLSSRFVAVEPAAVDRAIAESQKTICDCLDLDLIALWQFSPNEPNIMTMTELYRPHGGPQVPSDFSSQEKYFPWGLKKILAGQTIRVESMNDLPPEADRDREVWEHFGVKSILTTPLIAGSEAAFGFVGFHTVRNERQWPDEIVRRLSLVSQIFANALHRKRINSALRESEEQLNLAAESAEIGMWSLDTDDQRFWATDRAREIFGYAEHENITMTRFLDSVHPTCREPVGQAVQRAVDEDLPVDIEYRIVLPDGAGRWLHSCGRLQKVGPGKSRRLLGATVDITERKEAEGELQRAFAEVQDLKRRLELENAYLQREHVLQHGGGRIVGESPVIMDMLKMVEQVAPTTTTVLVEGETGTGKELVSHRIHELSPRKHRSLVKVNCAALPSALVESELFGREKGAYTGAVSRESGRFEVADGSTVLLDEIAELPLELQSKLLRVLEEGQFERVGSPRTLTTDVRVIAATNRDLRAEVEAGRFRRDLFFRLAVFPIRVPPLRERRGDIPLLVWAIVQELSVGMNKAVESIRREDLERLQRHDWSGNVRELRNVVERALILSDGPVLRINLPSAPLVSDDSVLSMDEVQRRHIVKVLEIAGGRIRGAGGAAELMDIKPTTLRSRMQRLGLDPRELRDERSSS